jgi:hypothetical protein
MFLLPSIAQLILWPNFQIRLLLPHGFVISILVTMAAWRFWTVARTRGVSSAGSSPGNERHLRATARIELAFAAICLPFYAVFAGMALHNFRLLLRCNELSRVAAYNKCRDLLQPGNRLFVAIMPGDQIFHEIGWRLQFFDHKENPVIELQPGSVRPHAGDVIYYHRRMARVKPPTSNVAVYKFEEHGDAYLHVGWSRCLSAMFRGKPPLEVARGGNEYTVYKVTPASPDT